MKEILLSQGKTAQAYCEAAKRHYGEFARLP